MHLVAHLVLLKTLVNYAVKSLTAFTVVMRISMSKQ